MSSDKFWGWYKLDRVLASNFTDTNGEEGETRAQDEASKWRGAANYTTRSPQMTSNYHKGTRAMKSKGKLSSHNTLLARIPISCHAPALARLHLTHLQLKESEDGHVKRANSVRLISRQGSSSDHLNDCISRHLRKVLITDHQSLLGSSTEIVSAFRWQG
ncbi:unnamed protein product [Trichogramma brassicae]|uniref:Uncharacterized protein n=1 Tax=Trichogramma brassicae TaxID=86971 RepID=A0A6H5IIA9_9HYME|nr:unnamed protein product [Trichogramma brassicae]